MTFPIGWKEEGLGSDDIGRLGQLLARTAMEIIPCREVFFIAGEESPDAGGDREENYPESWRMGARMAIAGKKAIADREGGLVFLPLWHGRDRVTAAAVLVGCDAVIFEASEQWLVETSRTLSREILLTRKAAIDPVTGLLGVHPFREELAFLLAGRSLRHHPWSPRHELHPVSRECGEKGSPPADYSCAIPDARDSCGFALALIEIAPRSQNVEKMLAAINRAAACLESFIGDYAPPYALGAGLFASLWPESSREVVLGMGKAILRFLKREGFPRVHVGIAVIPAAVPTTPEECLQHGWQALRTARGRGPYALCAREQPQADADHPLRLPDDRTMAALRGLWREKERFTVALVIQDGWSEQTCSLGRILSLLGPGIPTLTVGGGEAYVFFADLDGASAREKLLDLLATMRGGKTKKALAHDLSFSAGIAAYPFGRFRKNEIPGNARKALLHTAFFGPGTVTVFDGVSLNISGDVYYNEGDLARAAREYRLGLEVDPGNVNLLNSLAVNYAQMNRYKTAIPLFEKALQQEPANYMALFNLGHAYLASHRETESLGCLEKAFAVEDKHFDLLVILGELLLRGGRYDEAIAILEKCESVGLQEGAWKGEGPEGGAPPADRLAAVSKAPAMAQERPDGGSAASARDGAGAAGAIPGRGGRRVERGAAQRFLGKAHQIKGSIREAIVCLQRAIRFNAGDWEAMALLGQLYAQERQGNDIALSLCHKAIEIDDSQSLAWFCLGQVQHAAGDNAAAQLSLRQSLRLDPRNNEALFLLGTLFEEEKRFSRARSLYERVIRFVPGHRQAVSALQRLRQESSPGPGL